MNIRPLAYSLGAEVSGVDLSRPIDANKVAEIRRAWLKYSVIAFPGQALTCEQHLAFSRCFGELELHPIPAARHPDYPEIMVVSNKPSAVGPSITAETGRQWHSDGAYTLRPPTGSLLYCREIPAVGGDTWFTSMYAAYNALSAPIKKLVDGLSVVNSIAKQTRTRDPDQDISKDLPPVLQKMVRIHPETGRKSLYLNETVTIEIHGLSRSESEALLAFLYTHSVKPEFTYRHRWHPQDLVMWDNRCTMHLAPKDYSDGQPRYMCRTTLVGEPCGMALGSAIAYT